MKMRRRLAGLVALIALVFSFAETARASACDQTMPAAQTHSQHGMPGHNSMPAGSHHDSMPNCPLNAGQLGCATTVSIPATYTNIAAPAHEVGVSFSNDVVLPHAVRSTAIFHPPRF